MAFDIIEKGFRALPTYYTVNGYEPSYTQKTLAFEMCLNLATADRDVYNTIDWIKELGGFQRGLRTIFSVFLLVLTYKNYETYMVSKLF